VPLGTSGRLAPGPRGHILLGSLPDLARDPIATLMDAWQTYGDVARFRLVRRYEAFLLVHPDSVKRVLQEDNPNYPKHPFTTGKLKAMVGEGLLTSAGSFWLRQRRLIQPAFHRQRLASLGTLMTEATERRLATWDAPARDGRPIDVASEMMRLTLDIIARSMFSVDVSGSLEEVERAVGISLADIIRRINSVIDFPRWVPTSNNRKFLGARRSLDRIVYGFIEARRRSGEDNGDLLSMLLHAQDADTGETMTDLQVRDEVMTIFLAGHETTAITLTWTLYLLSIHPEIARRHVAELESVLDGRAPTVADLASLPYNRMVIEESMRLYPPAWVVERTPLADDVIGGYRIPAGSSVYLSSYVTHRHPDFWENPEGFDPERFTAERSAGRPRYAYFPFGGGPRMCIGNNFALLEAQLLLATIARRYRLDLVPGHPVATHPMITLRTRYGMKMRPVAASPSEERPS
jgi:cytochrome P450